MTERCAVFTIDIQGSDKFTIQFKYMRSISLKPLILLLLVACGNKPDQPADTSTAAIDSTIVVPSGFVAKVAVPSLANNRHIAINSKGDIFVKLGELKDGKGIYVLRDSAGNGQYKVISSFGKYAGTGIAIKNGYLYASSNDEVFRYKLDSSGQVIDTSSPERIITGLRSESGFHDSKSIALDNAGNIYVNIGAPSNVCMPDDHSKHAPDPCPLLENSGGIWQFKTDQPDQSYPQGVRYATGIRNIVGLDWNNQQNELYAMQHGRDILHNEFPGLYDDTASAELPSEEFFWIKKGGDFGWPYCYYDQIQKKKLLNPEYGGDTKKEGRCAGVEQPLYGFPGHWAPNAVLFYTGTLFPERYRNGVFIAFHGSWNRTPLKQQGFCVAFLPFKDGKVTGNHEIFASGFTGKDSLDGPNESRYRPCGLAQGPNGELFISDSKQGRVWKVGYAKEN